MRKYEKEFNEEYERGYEDGRNSVITELDEADSGFEKVKKANYKHGKKRKIFCKE